MLSAVFVARFRLGLSLESLVCLLQGPRFWSLALAFVSCGPIEIVSLFSFELKTHQWPAFTVLHAKMPVIYDLELKVL